MLSSHFARCLLSISCERSLWKSQHRQRTMIGHEISAVACTKVSMGSATVARHGALGVHTFRETKLLIHLGYLEIRLPTYLVRLHEMHFIGI